ncbi:DUF3993 domain-containing protein [Bacillus sp. EB01]|uniref:DUF3993 domain-containing protein n=1 Tax=Bacillus sp. EB01 TaxID=1347086 RepID=UPI0006948F4E|nr:DUF3993 domain-containing protein [Bacillus sp. EB01]
MKKTLLVICAVLLIAMPMYPHATEGKNKPSREEIFTVLENAFLAQVSLSEKLRTKEEINEILSEYFTEEYAKEFWDINVAEENGKFVTYGTDFAPYYIPYYQFSDKTEVVFEGDKAYVFEFFPETHEGPVGYESHFEGLLLVKNGDSWKVAEYLYDTIPESVIEQADSHVKLINANNQVVEEAETTKEVEAASLQFQLGMNPIGNLIQYGAIISSGETESISALFEQNDDQLVMGY